jgi:hypothetical protein
VSASGGLEPFEVIHVNLPGLDLYSAKASKESAPCCGSTARRSLAPPFNWFSWIVLLLCLALSLVNGSANTAGIDLFETKIRPALVQHCYECHSQESKKIKGGLRLDSWEALLRGGDSGAAINADTPSKSLLISALNQIQFEMPPSGKLDNSIIRSFEQWVEMGAPTPVNFQQDGNPNESRTIAKGHWAFDPLSKPEPPLISGSTWVKNPIDQFILHQLQDKGLQPSSRASSSQLVRRSTFDVTGLPSTDSEAVSSELTLDQDWYSHHIDRLLTNPQFGERWGRIWLDLARYADTNGVDENFNFLHAWRYRDYVVRSLNQDKRYDRFLIEQIAGDLMPEGSTLQEQADQITATGFLTLGPKMLAEQDKDKLLIDIVDEQIDVLAKTAMGLTIACARCHDHKFDPISTEDYYALGGIFASTKTMANTNHVSFWTETILPDPSNETTRTKHAVEIQHRKKAIERLKTEEDSEEKTKKLKRLNLELKELKKKGPDLPRAMAVIDGTARDIPVHIRGSHLNLTETTVARGFPKKVSEKMKPIGKPEKSSGRLELGKWLTARDHPLTARVIVNRIWQGYFGVGIVSTPSNFGVRGESPSHPLLLDWLANELLDHDWSLKHIHRLILTSATYQQTSHPSQINSKVDPENRSFWRQNQKRLSAESIRDAILLVGNKLDLKIGGKIEKADKNETYYRGNGAEFESNRRALYLPVIRGRGYEMFNTFDYSESGTHLAQRTTTIVPHQALFMLNAPLVKEASENLAAQILASNQKGESHLIRQLFHRIFFRLPTSPEESQALEYLDKLQDLSESSSTERTPVGILIQSLIAANEFIYVD